MTINDANNTALVPSTKVEQPAPIVVQSSPTKNYPGFSTLLGFGALGVIGYYLINKTQDKKEEKKEQKEQKKKEKKFSDNLDSQKLKDSKGKLYNPRELAARYKQAIYGDGTSEQALMDLARISKYGRWAAISNAYTILTKGILNNDIQDELSTEEYTIFSKIKKSNYWFAAGEYVYAKKNYCLVYENKKVKVEDFYWTYKTGTAIGKIKKAKKIKYKGKMIVVYLTTGYSNKWIWSHHLITDHDRAFG